MGNIGCGCIDLISTYNGGGSGGGFIGTVRLTKGNYTVKVGAGQYFKRTVMDSNNNKYELYYSKAETSSISGVVSCKGANIYNAGPAPTLSVTPISTTLNRAGNAGGNTGDAADTNDTSKMVVGAAVYGSYGKGSGENPSYQIDTNATQHSSYAGTGYVKIIYKGS